ncbi:MULTISPECIES: hypothetical protein [unclassified Metabacillus]|uniref:hypothetical protein n=1 Tax=unclassified Metabacillus TaxID=2675274 RepID=UPI001E589418|nr:hypothetical protein [Metabacillus sp. B2-18]UGB30790.1 hypothetical protein LPC09_24360 [Metabacillus sp. B2-18]
MKKVLILSILCFCMAGCQFQAGERYEPQQEDVNGLRLMRDGHGTYDNQELDDEQFVPNQNPNFIDLTETRPDKGDDQSKLEEAIMNDDTLSLGRVNMNANHINVTVYTTEDLSKKEMKEKTKEIHKNMITALPRYRIDVNVEKK